ncbi:MAG TPA: hypothetical protein VHX63_01040 [Acidobacteriaceae bacterium]|jgi:hypothetical protein|nr:hypothetical protein [Acidobacteriaceae bacterium]
MRFLLTTFLSALILFLWGGLTLAVIPWHSAVLHGVRNEAAVLKTLKEQAVNAGVYSIPIEHKNYTATSPFAMVIYRPGGLGMPAGAIMAVSFATYWLASIVAALLLPRKEGLSYTRRVLFFLGLGIFTSLTAHITNWTWSGYSAGYTFMAIFDLLVGWLLAGLFLARFLPSGVSTK